VNKVQAILPLFILSVLTGCKTVPAWNHSSINHFVAIENFSKFSRVQNVNGETVLLSPKIKSPTAANEIITSWNADAPDGTFVKIEASAALKNHATKFYTLGEWSPDGKVFPRTSIRGQKDPDGNVDTDTLILNQPAHAAQIRITLGGTNGAIPNLKFLGVSFSNTKIPVITRESNRTAWGKIIMTPEHSQHGAWTNKGWCSPTSLSMALSRWAEILHRPEMDLTVPQVAAKVYDSDFAGMGNWPFNTAFASSFPGMRSYVTRFDDISEVEDWIAAGIPVILSARWAGCCPDAPWITTDI
jgi:Peptidase_C39 like family